MLKSQVNLKVFQERGIGTGARFVDSMERVRYAFEFTHSLLLLLRETDKTPHG
jgi:hypothetical protein